MLCVHSWQSSSSFPLFPHLLAQVQELLLARCSLLVHRPAFGSQRVVAVLALACWLQGLARGLVAGEEELGEVQRRPGHWTHWGWVGQA